jgi:hypothetical protein
MQDGVHEMYFNTVLMKQSCTAHDICGNDNVFSSILPKTQSSPHPLVIGNLGQFHIRSPHFQSDHGQFRTDCAVSLLPEKYNPSQ